MNFEKEELELLRSKKIVRKNLLSYSKKLVEKLDFISKEKKISFSESVYLVINDMNIIYCANCNLNKTKFISVKEGYKKYCSTKCSNTHIETKQSKEKSYLEKYGVINPSFSEEIRKKISQKNKNQSDITKDKRKKTNLEKYGYEYNILNPIYLEKKLKSISDPNTAKKRKQTNLEKYGVDVPLKSDLIKNKFINTNLERWGSEHFKLSDKYKELDDKRHLIKLNSQHTDIIVNKLENKVYYIKCILCNNNFEISTNAYNIRKNNKLEICTVCNPIEYNISLLEKDLLNYISSIYNGNIINNYRKIGFELDIFLPELSLGIEFNGIYWHSEFFKQKDYHYNKYIKCLENNINLIQIWEDDWNYKKEIIKSIIKNKIKSSEKIWARKCEIREVTDTNLIKEFLNKNHIQGWCVSSKKIGLFYNNELVSLMTLGNLRKTLGQKSKEGDWELLRFANKLNITVVGGASKILNYFVKNNKPSKIISYSNNDYSNGNLYRKLRFNKLGDNISYFWVVDNIKRNRWNFRKDKLVKMGYDPKKTETQIMHELKNYRIFDSGNTKWELNF
jgi:hypothetical protein